MYDNLATQSERVLAYMQERGPITSKFAMLLLGIYRLGARIFDLKKQGYHIVSEWVVEKNRFGEDCRIKQYRLWVPEEEQDVETESDGRDADDARTGECVPGEVRNPEVDGKCDPDLADL